MTTDAGKQGPERAKGSESSKESKQDSMKTLTPKEIVEILMTRDFAAQAMGIKLEAIEEAFARISMTVRHDMLNGLAVCHGGMIFALADTAFAYACNSRNRKTLAMQCSINFIASAVEGDLLIAEAREVSLKGRTGLYDINVTNQNGTVIAHFRGTSYGTSSASV